MRSKQFRELVQELAILVGVTATESLDIVTTKELKTPVGPFIGMKLKDRFGFMIGADFTLIVLVYSLCCEQDLEWSMVILD